MEKKAASVVAGQEVAMVEMGNRVLCFYRTTAGATGDAGNSGAAVKKEATVVARLVAVSPTIADKGRSSGGRRSLAGEKQRRWSSGRGNSGNGEERVAL